MSATAQSAKTTMRARAGGWLVVTPARGDPRLRLVCLPHSGAGAMAFAPWAARLPPNIELFCFQPPGRGPRIREAGIPGMEALLDAFLDAATNTFSGNYVIFGHSLGGTLAYRLAGRLCHLPGARPPRRLVLSAALPPTPQALEWRLAALGPPPLSDATIRERVLALGGTPPAILNSPLARPILSAVRHDFEMLLALDPRDNLPVNCPTQIWFAAEDASTPGHLHAGWTGLIAGPLELQTHEGNHFTGLQPDGPLLDRLIGDLRADLLEAARWDRS